MPEPWPDGEHAGDDDEPRLSQPVHPDDRLWRHPSELAWGVAPPTPPSGLPKVELAAPAGTGRPWGLLVTSSLLGAAVALGTVALLGGLGPSAPDRIVDRVGVRDTIVDGLTSFRDPTPQGLPDVVERVAPSVVRIEVPSGSGATGGSGVVVRDDGHIITNAHVVGDLEELTIVRSDGRAVPGRVVGVDPVTDLAVVAPTEDGDTWVAAVRGPAAELRVGDPTVAVAASPDGSTPSVTLGMVNALSGFLSLSSGTTLHGLVETDVPVPASATGGALCDRAGRVVGLTTGAGGEDGPGYATSMEAAWPTAESLIEEGEVRHAWLGIEGKQLGAAETAELGLDRTGPVLIETVDEGGPAAVSGLLVGDVVLAIDGTELGSMSDLVVAVRNHAPGDVATVTVLRDGTTFDLEITLGPPD